MTTNVSWSHGTARNEVVTKQQNNIIFGAAIERNRCPVYSNGQRPFGHVTLRQTLKVITHQRSKSTFLSAASTSTFTRPTTTTTAVVSRTTSVWSSATTTAMNSNHASQNTSVVAAIVTPQPNGICRIVRLPGEQKKLPDRINYDRRGLTAIPIFENEPNLRLLSLQHNLINVFRIPKAEPVMDSGGPPYNHSKPPIIDDVAIGENVQQTKCCMRSLHTPTLSPSSQQSLIPPSPPIQPSPPSLSPSIHQANYSASQLFKRYNFLQSLNLNLSASLKKGTQQKQQQHQQQHQNHHNHRQKLLQRQLTFQHYRFAMKKSKSFINNYSRQVNSAKRNAPIKPPFHKADSKMLMLLGRTNLKSFDSATSSSGSASALTMVTTDSVSTMVAGELVEEDAYRQQLEIKNRQLHPFYGTIFQNLVFLDLYDNQIERIANLDGLPVLSVLLLGKNRITDLSGLMSLKTTLRVLDLHGNKITSIGNKINCLQGLKSLNLAGNQIRQINQNDFNGLENLKELNLKRNRIRRINGFQHLLALQRLWMSHNDVHKVEDISSIANAIRLLEVTIENNPVSLAGDCVSYLVSYLPSLVSLSHMPITEQVRKAAMTWRRNKELSEENGANNSSDVSNNIRREEVISNARTNWELLRSQQTINAAMKWSEQRSLKQRELTKIKESNETVVGYEDLQEYIKLPPIKKEPNSIKSNSKNNSNSNTHANSNKNSKINNSHRFQDEQNRAHRGSRSSNSILGPKIDSSPSSHSSDNEETPKKKNLSELSRNKNQQNHQQMPTSRRREHEKSVLGLESHKIEQHHNEYESKIENEFSSEATRLVKNIDKEEGKTLTQHQTTSGKQRIVPQSDINICELMNNNTPLQQATIDAESCSTSNNLQVVQQAHPQHQQQLCTPTSVTTITNNSNLLFLGYDLESASCIGGNVLEAIAVSKSMTSIPVTTIVTTPLATTLMGVTTTTETTTFRRYMRASPMPSQVVGGVGCYSSSGGCGNTIGMAGGAGEAAAGAGANDGAIAGKLNLAFRNNMAMVNGQLHVNSNGPVETVTAGQTTTATLTPTSAAAVGPKTQPIECTSILAGSNTTQAFNCPNTLSNDATAPIMQSTVTPTVAATTKLTALEREREQGGDYLIEICGRYLNIYGQGALRFIDKHWNPAKANDVHTLNFSYIKFNNIVAVLSRIKVRFPRAEHFVFRETNICCLGQLNALAELQGITSLFIESEGNAITTKVLWRQYAIYRLSHWGLKLINSSEISATETDEANKIYAGISDLVHWSIPDVMLIPLLARLRLQETCTESKMSPKDWLMKPENKSLRLVVGKEALQWKKPTTNATVLGSGHIHSKATIQFSNDSQQTNATSTFNNGQQTQQHQIFGNSNSNNNINCNGNNDLVDLSSSVDAGIETGTFTGHNPMAFITREWARAHFIEMLENTCNATEKLNKLETLWTSLLLYIVRNTLLDYSQLDAYLKNVMADIMK